MVEIYGLKNCDTCRKALKALPDATLVDVRADGVPDALMARAFTEFGDKLLNTRSTTWRGLDEAERAQAPLDLLAKHPALMKRPLISAGGTLFLGWTAQTADQVNAAI
jgi:arsenate reductase